MAESDLSKKQQFFALLDSLDHDDEVDCKDESKHQSLLNLALDPSAPKKIVAKSQSIHQREHKPISTPTEALTIANSIDNPQSFTPSKPLSSPKPKEKERPSIIAHDMSNLRELAPQDPHGNSADYAIVIQDTQSASTSEPARPKPQIVAAIPRATGKRKRPVKFKDLPQAQRVFSGLVFYFFPNNDINTERRIRIIKAIERGATWVDRWQEGITHVIADKGLSMAEFIKHADFSEIPEHLIVVNETYASDCIDFQFLLDPEQPQYRLKDDERKHSRKTVQRQPPEQHTDESLQLKPAEGNERLADDITPSRIERATQGSDSTHTSLHAAQSQALSRDHKKAAAVPNQDRQHESPTGHRKRDHYATAKDPLAEAVVEAKAFADIGIESDDETESRPTSAAGLHASSDDEQGPSDEGRPMSSSSTRPVPKWQNGFSCTQDPLQAKATKDCPNADVVDLLQQMAKYYDTTRDQWRTIAYRKAISVLKKHPTEIKTAEEAAKLPGIGSRLALKIEEIKWTHRLRRLENANNEPHVQALQTFLGIYGVGIRQATAWVDQGHRTLNDLIASKVTLTENQKIGLEHYDDFAARIPRKEVERLGAIVTTELHRIDPAFATTIGGSYRRGAPDSGDIDLVITHPTSSIEYTRAVVVNTLVPRLLNRGFLTAGLAVTSRDDGTKWHGACVLPGPGAGERPRPWRRIDLLLVQYDEIGAAMLYFTGNDIFNRSMRLLARKKGMRLNQRGLYKDVMRGPGQVKLNEGVKIAGKDEREIFEMLGVPWREVDERDL